MLKITAKSIIEELEKRAVPVEVIDERISLARFQLNGQWHLFRSSTQATTSHIGYRAANQKYLALRLLSDVDLQSPHTEIYTDDDAAKRFLKRHGKIVVKPTDSSHGNGVTVDITDVEMLLKAIKTAKERDSKGAALLQEQVGGTDLRVLIIGGKFAAAALRIPAEVTGDGVSTLRELIHIENTQNPDRGEKYRKRLNVIDVTAAERYLGARIDDTRPLNGEVVRVTGPANIGTGGRSIDVTDTVPAEISKKAEQISKTLGLPTCGVDFMVSDTEDVNSYRYIEVNACPSFGLHLFPSEGKTQPVAKLFVDSIMEAV